MVTKKNRVVTPNKVKVTLNHEQLILEKNKACDDNDDANNDVNSDRYISSTAADVDEMYVQASSSNNDMNDNSDTETPMLCHLLLRWGNKWSKPVYLVNNNNYYCSF